MLNLVISLDFEFKLFEHTAKIYMIPALVYTKILSQKKSSMLINVKFLDRLSHKTSKNS